MICECCNVARDFYEYKMFNPACIFCGARLIQRLGRLNIAESDCIRRRRAVLADWMAMGHSEQQLRTMAKAGPVIGPEEVTESVNRPQKRRR